MTTQAQIGIEAAKIARDDVLRVAAQQGVTLKKAMLRLKQALNAKETKFFQMEGRIVTQVDVVAHGPRLQAIKMTLDLYSAFPDHKTQIGFADEDIEGIEITFKKGKDAD